jgi:SAM-dependent methyltransferase
MYRRVAPFIGERILEVGAGIGNFTELLLDRELVVATDKFDLCVEHLRRRLGARLKADPLPLDLAAPPTKALKPYRFDTIICMNVLEHVADDKAALATMVKCLKPSGELMLLAPAHQVLFGATDEAVDHFRRYAAGDMQGLLAPLGVEIIELQYVNPMGALGWLVSSRLLRRRTLSRSSLKLYEQLVPALRRVDAVRLPFGLSVWVRARRAAAVRTSSSSHE